MPIKIVVDSSSDISKEEAVQLGIEVIPMIVSFDKDEYYDGVDLTPKEFYEKLIESDVLPKTSQITPFRYMEVYERNNSFTTILTLIMYRILNMEDDEGKEILKKIVVHPSLDRDYIKNDLSKNFKSKAEKLEEI